jgi:hypothetical protein
MNRSGDTGSRGALRRILGTAGPDAGCDLSGDVLDQLIEAEGAGRPAAEVFPKVAAHLASCPDCHEDYLGLREAARIASGRGREES